MPSRATTSLPGCGFLPRFEHESGVISRRAEAMMVTVQRSTSARTAAARRTEARKTSMRNSPMSIHPRAGRRVGTGPYMASHGLKLSPAGRACLERSVYG
eukprot:1755732-Prymnesium_polylepis.1